MTGHRALGVTLMRCNVTAGEHCVHLADDDVIGHVRPVSMPSHLRRGRMQVSPWWQATDRSGRSIDLLFRTRLEAIAFLVDLAAKP